jgi:hypothetical protein
MSFDYGETWTTSTALGDESYAVGYINGRIIAMRDAMYGGGPMFKYSINNGVTWFDSAATVPTNYASSYSSKKCKESNGRLIIHETYSLTISAPRMSIATTVDGINVTRSGQIVNPNYMQECDFCFVNGVYFWSDNTGLYSSTDAITWTLRNSTDLRWAEMAYVAEDNLVYISNYVNSNTVLAFNPSSLGVSLTDVTSTFGADSTRIASKYRN